MKQLSLIRSPALAGAVLLLGAGLHVGGRSSEPPGLATALRPFVDNHTLAGAVGLVASKDHVLAVEPVGFADVAKQEPMRTNALFWIASQSKPITAAAFIMLVNEGKRYLSEAAVKPMTSKQTGTKVAQEYGLGWDTSGGRFGHGGAYSTSMSIDPQRGLILIWMVQHAGYAKPDGPRVLPTFTETALGLFAHP